MAKSNAILVPANVKPVKYQITLEPDLKQYTFKGRVITTIEILEQTSSITMNSIEIEIQSCVLTEGGKTLPSQNITYDDKQETVTFDFGVNLAEGAASLDIAFTGDLNDKLRGFYRSQYQDIDGNDQLMASTQFESTDARRAFPCWDEPALKATFELTLVIPSGLTAVSNMPVVSESEANSSKTITFAESPIMSTYLLAFVIGDLTYIEKTGDNGTLMRVFTTRGREAQGQFALETSLRLLKFFNGYFGIPYPLPKMDHIAIPDFAAGAMENWGAITYRETALLVDPDNTSAGTRQTVASIIAHEMAHMWFGDLVTMAWWNDLWLNESFASWMGDKATDNLFPEWEVWTQFVSGDTNRGLSLDGLRNSHPIEQEVKNPDEIGQLFDAISYSKGASVLRMLETFIGADVFQRGLHQYLTKHQYDNAQRRDLWNALGDSSGQPVADIMDTWVIQTGYPVLDTELQRSPTGVNVHLSQRKFTYDDILSPGESDTALWRVPVGVTTNGASVSLLMDDRETSTTLETSDGEYAWVKVNPEQTGFFRVKYSPEDLQRLAEPIRTKELSASDRLGIQNDAYALSRAGMIPATDFLAIAEAYKNEDNAPVCSDLSSNMGGMDTLLWEESFYGGFQAFSRSIMQETGRKVGWDAKPGEGHLDTLLRSTVLSHLGGADDEDTLREAAARFKAYVENPANVSPDIRGIVFGLAAQKGDRSTYDTMWELRAKASMQEEQVRFLYGLTSFEQPELLQETLNRALGDEIRAHEAVSVLGLVAGNRSGRDLAWQFLKDNWAELDRRYGEGGFALMRLVGITSGFTTMEMREDVERFFTDHPAPGAERTIRQSLERIQLNSAWLQRNRHDLSNWFVG
ncbi:MAG: hypothetical protein BZY79_05690 [SAR202 cluster bacterium Casp-Chloro-G4]|nr:M1 family metallopeptidase [Chloroflexota bacterium]MDA1228649.1 M1 family metallopeptidase [Chloroflexota bacterium]PKB61067.1 MAG: hypothetical protein BZY79_05690 [SAR202 cluster bacterium Casp-Chloro-G4]